MRAPAGMGALRWYFPLPGLPGGMLPTISKSVLEVMKLAAL